MTLTELLDAPAPDVKALGAHLDALPGAERVAAVRGITRRQQARLYEAAQGARPLTLQHFVAPSVPAMTPVRHEGRNSLPAFRFFAKCFMRPDDAAAAAKELWGYNDNPALVEVTTGPGYYVAYETGNGEVLVDYTRLPPRTAPGLPRILSNSARLGFFVYRGTKDAMRGVSAHVSIGRASRGTHQMDNWFVLCRVDAP